jgi:hypothetical protein
MLCVYPQWSGQLCACRSGAAEAAAHRRTACMWYDQQGRGSGAPEVHLVPPLLTNRRPAPEGRPAGIGRLEDRLNGVVPAADRLNGAVSA